MTTRYDSNDYRKCAFNPLTPELYDSNPRLEVAIGKYVCNENVARYIIILYDPSSPIVLSEPDIDKRKNAALQEAGLDDSAIADSLKELEDENFIAAVVAYLINFTNNRLWQRIVVNEQLYEEYCKRLLQPVRTTASTTSTDEDGKPLRKGLIVQEKDELTAYTIKAKLREELDNIGAALDGYYRQMFGGDDVLIKKNKVRFTPEMMAGR